MTIQAPNWLNADFTRKILKNSENDDSIEVMNLMTEPVVGKGENYGSLMIRCNVEYSKSESGVKIKQKKSLIVKIAPTLDDSQKELMQMFDVFSTEIKMMTTTLIKMNEILKDDESRLSPLILYTEIGDPSLLVIEDLTPLGYRMADRQTGLDLDHCLIAITRLAKFHASSVALWEKDPEAMMEYNGGVYNSEYPAIWKDYVTGGIKNIANEVLEWSELGHRAQIYSAKLLKLSELSYERVARCSRPKDNEFNVLNHGDCWLNNMMFRYNDNGKVIDHIFIDFQLCLWSSPAIDILQFINTSSAKIVDLYHRETVVKEYLSTLTRTMKILCCKTKPPNMKELEKSLKEHELYGFMATCIILPIVLLDKNEAKSVDQMLQQNHGKDNKIYKGLAYREVMIRRLPEWDARGLMDV